MTLAEAREKTVQPVSQLLVHVANGQGVGCRIYFLFAFRWCISNICHSPSIYVPLTCHISFNLKVFEIAFNLFISACKKIEELNDKVNKLQEKVDSIPGEVIQPVLISDCNVSSHCTDLIERQREIRKQNV